MGGGAGPAHPAIPRRPGAARAHIRSAVQPDLRHVDLLLAAARRRRAHIRPVHSAAEAAADDRRAHERFGRARRAHHRRSECHRSEGHHGHRLVGTVAGRKTPRGVAVGERQRRRHTACFRRGLGQRGRRIDRARAVPDRRRKPRLARGQQGLLVHALSRSGPAGKPSSTSSSRCSSIASATTRPHDAYVMGKDFPKVAEIVLDNRFDPDELVVSVANGDGGAVRPLRDRPDGASGRSRISRTESWRRPRGPTMRCI